MLKRPFILLSCLSFFFLCIQTGYGQSPLDPYKYVIVPKKFDFLRKENQYRVNSQTKYHFDQNGFQTLLKGEDYPADLKANPCLGAEAKVIDDSNSFTTKLRISLTNCLDQVVYTSEEGKSKEKSYEKTYSQALKEAFVSIGELNYEYRPEQAMIPAEMASPSPVEASPVPTAAPVITAAVAEPAAANETAAIVAANETVEVAKEPAVEEVSTEREGATTYGNENITFFLIDQGEKLAAYVISSKSETYSQGEMIGTFEKSSLPNVYRAEWKDMDEDIEQTTAYFDDKGNLKIDVKRKGKIEVLSFEKK